VTGHGGEWGCETSMLPHFPGNQLTDGGEVVSLTCQMAVLYFRKFPTTHFCYRRNQPQGHSAPGRIRSIRKPSYLIRNEAHYLKQVFVLLNSALIIKVLWYWIVRWVMNCKGIGRKLYYSENWLKILKKTTKSIIQANKWPGQDWNQKPHDVKSWVSPLYIPVWQCTKVNSHLQFFYL
jgi:hypothetical protein